MNFSFDYDKSTTALIIQVQGFSCSMLLEEHNQKFVRWNPPESVWTTQDPGGSREPTPAATAGESEGYLVLPYTRNHRKYGYYFGTSERDTHVLLPQSLAKGISSVHFRIFLSKHMTWMVEPLAANEIVVDGKLIGYADKWALHPESPNEVGIQEVRLRVHIPSQNTTCTLDYDEDAESTIFRRSQQSRTSASTSDYTLSAEPVDGKYGYHICWNRPIQPHNTPKFEAICIRTGQHCVAKRISGAAREDLQYADIYLPSNESEYIISYLKYVRMERMIITEYMESTTLEYLISRRRPAPASVYRMYGQLIDGLHFLQKHDIIHRGIQPSAILVSPGFSGEFDTAKFTAFSDYVKGKQTERWQGRHQHSAPEIWNGGPYDTRSDVYSLNSVLYECLSDAPMSPDLAGTSGRTQETPPMIEERRPKDSVPSHRDLEALKGAPEILTLIRVGLNDDPGQRRLASMIRLQLHNWMGTSLEIPFRSFSVTRERWVTCRSKNKVGWIRISDLLDAISSQGRATKEIRRYLHVQCEFDKEKYCRKRDAMKLCHAFHLTDLEKHIRNQTRGTRRVSDLESYEIFYHAPSRMVNVSHIFRVVGEATALECMERFHPESRQEVRGVREWEGHYIDHKTFSEMALFLSRKPKLNLQTESVVKRTNEVLSDRFSSISVEDLIILVTRAFDRNMLILRRRDCSVDWMPFSDSSGNFLTVEESVSKCNTLGLPELQASMEDLRQRPRALTWPIRDLEWISASAYDTSLDYSSDTSVSSTTSFREQERRKDDNDDDECKFRFR